MNPEHTITVVRRSDDWMAYLDGDKRLWESGRTNTEAIGRLVLARPEVLGLVVWHGIDGALRRKAERTTV